MARMYQKYKIKNVSFEFESQISAGNTNIYKISWGFMEDVNLGYTIFTGYNPLTTGVTKAQALSLSPSGNFPAWVPKHIISPPRRWYTGKLYDTRG